MKGIIEIRDKIYGKLKMYSQRFFPLYTKEITFILSFLSILLILQLFNQEKPNSIHILEPQAYGGQEEIKVFYRYQGGDNHSIILPLPELNPSKTEINHILEAAQKELIEKLNQELTGDDNQDPVLSGPLQLPAKIGDCAIDYELVGYHLMNEKGWIFPDQVNDQTQIKIPYIISLDYGDKEEENLVGQYDFMVNKDSLSDQYLDAFGVYMLEEYVKELDTGIEPINLPEDYTFFDKDPDHMTYRSLLLIPLIFTFFSLLSHMEKKMKVTREKSRARVHLTYIVHSFLLFYQSGMTVYKSLWYALSSRVELMTSDDRFKMGLTKAVYMMEQSQDLHQVIDAINQCFMIREAYRFTRLISQNLKLGDSQMENQLESMSHEMWEQRLHHARKESEKASTKLVLPMLLIFIIILLLTIVPAFMEVETLI